MPRVAIHEKGQGQMSVKNRNEVMRRVHDVFGRELEIVEASRNLPLVPLPCDAKGAVAKDPGNCLLVHTCNRMFGSRAAVFWKSSAYIDMVDADGVTRVHRFMIGAAGIRALTAFDRGKKWPVGAGIDLLAPKHGRRRSVRARQSRAWNASPAGQAFYRVGKAKRNVKSAEIRLARADQTAKQVRTNKPFASAEAASARGEARAAHKYLQTRRAELATAESAAAKVKRNAGRQTRTSHVFDLTTRNGALGNYRFQEVR